MENLKHAYSKESADTKVSQAATKPGNSVPLKPRWVLLEVVYLMMYHAAIKGIPLAEFHANVISPYTTKTGWADRFMAGAFTTTSMLLQQDDVVSVEKVNNAVTIQKGKNFQERLGAISLQAEDYEAEEALTYLELFGDELRGARASAVNSD